MNWISIAIAVLELVPAIIKAIKGVEEAIPVSGQGAEKLALIKEILFSISSKAEEVWPAIEKAIGAIVAIFNKLGIFKTSG